MQKTPKKFRSERMSSLIQSILSRCLHKYLEGQKGLATISKVETSGDLKWAKVWLSIVGGDDNALLQQLQSNIYDIQGEVNQELQTKIMPRLQFFLDTSPRYAAHIEEVFKHIHEEDDRPEA